MARAAAPIRVCRLDRGAATSSRTRASPVATDIRASLRSCSRFSDHESAILLAVAVGTEVASQDTAHAVPGSGRTRVGGRGRSAPRPSSRTADGRATGSASRAVALLSRRASTRTPAIPSNISASSTAFPTPSVLVHRALRLGALWAVGLVVARAGRPPLAPRSRPCDPGLGAWFIGRLLGALVVNTRASARAQGRHPIRQQPVVPGGPARGDRRGHLGRLAVPHPPTRRVGHARRCSWRSARCTSGPGCRTTSSPPSCSGGASAAAVHLDLRFARWTADALRRSRAALAGARRATPATSSSRRRATGEHVHVAEDDDGPLRVRVLGRDEADAQLLAKFWRFLFYKDGGPTLHLTRLEDVEHEAYTLLLADAGRRQWRRGRGRRRQRARRGAARDAAGRGHAARRRRPGRRDRRRARRASGSRSQRLHARRSRTAPEHAAHRARRTTDRHDRRLHRRHRRGRPRRAARRRRRAAREHRGDRRRTSARCAPRCACSGRTRSPTRCPSCSRRR